MGIPIEGEQPGSYTRYEQYPIENLYEEFQKAFDSGITAITWTQYTPYFNDGDTCEFGVHEYYVTTNPSTAASWAQEDFPDVEDDGYLDENYYDYAKPWVGYQGNEYPHPDGILAQDWPDLSIESAHYEFAMLETFGDHVQVVVTPNKVVVFEYSHD
jgi:hypothetical protein